MNADRDKPTKDRIAEGMSEAGHDPKKNDQPGQKRPSPAERISEGMSKAGHDQGSTPRGDDLRGSGPGRGAD